MRGRDDLDGPVSLLVLDEDPALLRRLAGPGRLSCLRPVFEEDGTDLAEMRAAIVDVDSEAGSKALRRLTGQGLPVVATSGSASLQRAVEVMRAGAHDFLVKPFADTQLLASLGRIVKDEPKPAAAVPVRPDHDFEDFIGASETMRRIYAQIVRIAPSNASVFITGESGTGKELCAEAVHKRSPRHNKPFVAINCGAIPKDLMESELFGHVRGAYTGATDDRAGATELAHQGTLFLDELCEMDLGLQAKLLRFLQTGTVQRVGDARPRRLDVRVLCATNREPDAEVAAGRLRADLYYRLHVLPIALPPLRERAGDVADLAHAFLARFAAEEGRGFKRFSPEALSLIGRYDWPGNVRQLQNLVRRIVVMHDGVEVSVQMVPLALANSGAEASPVAKAEPKTGIAPLWLEEQRIIESAIAAFGGNTARAAAALEISPSTIYRKRLGWASRGAA